MGLFLKLLKLMKIIVNIICADERWREISSVESVIEQVIESVEQRHALKAEEVNVMLANTDYVRSVNERYRGKNKDTNVLSFESPAIMRSYCLGDIVLSFDQVFAEALEKEVSCLEHLMHLVVHGMLHLLGYDHEQEDDALKMEKEEVEILRSLGVPSPYIS